MAWEEGSATSSSWFDPTSLLLLLAVTLLSYSLVLFLTINGGGTSQQKTRRAPTEVKSDATSTPNDEDGGSKQLSAIVNKTRAQTKKKPNKSTPTRTKQKQKSKDNGRIHKYQRNRVDRPISPVLARFLNDCDLRALQEIVNSNSPIANSSSNWNSIFRGIVMTCNISLSKSKPKMLIEEYVVEDPVHSSAKDDEDDGEITTQEMNRKESACEIRDYSTSDASPITKRERSASWKLDKQASLSSLSSSSLSNNGAQNDIALEVTPDQPANQIEEEKTFKQSPKPEVNVLIRQSPKRRKSRKGRKAIIAPPLPPPQDVSAFVSLEGDDNREDEVDNGTLTDVLAPSEDDNLHKLSWSKLMQPATLSATPSPASHADSIPKVVLHVAPPPGFAPRVPSPPPGLILLRPPPGLDVGRRPLRPEAPSFQPAPRLEFPTNLPPPPSFPMTPTSRSERSSTGASLPSSSGDDYFFPTPLADDAARFLLQRTLTDDGHEADDEQDSQAEEEVAPSVDLSFLE